MKGNLLIILLAIFLSACTQQKQEGYLINGNIAGLTSGGKVQLKILELDTNTGITLDSTEVVNGKFTFSGILESPYLHTIQLNDTLNIATIFLENSKVDIRGDINNLKDIEIIGSKEDSLFRSYSAYAGFDKRAGMEIIQKHPDYVYTAFITYYYFQSQNLEIETMDSILSGFSTTVRKSSYYKHLNKLYDALKQVRISKLAPEFEINDIDGELVRRSDFKGKYLLITFGGSFQRNYNPTLVKAYQKFKGKNFDIVSISIEKNREEWLNVIQEDSLTWTNLSEINGWGAITDRFGVKYIPQNFLIDTNGLILDKNIEYEKLEDILQNLLSN
jgi:peroxiredoxin